MVDMLTILSEGVLTSRNIPLQIWQLALVKAESSIRRRSFVCSICQGCSASASSLFSIGNLVVSVPSALPMLFAWLCVRSHLFLSDSVLFDQTENSGDRLA